ncbi:MAG: LpqB family beta-propeller domain-containing protein [Actinobacteria bacterium]|nr:LpqB family beta-propeller domain-containing protein [Actinomycetota bacterium]
MRRAVAAAAGLLLLTGCGLPLVDDVQDPERVRAEQQQRSDIQVLPPGPRDENTPLEVVRGFFGAQSNPDDGHASARAFLAPSRRATWKDSGPVNVFEQGLRITQVPDRPDAFSVTVERVGRIEADGSYSRDDTPITLDVELVRNSRRWEIADVPDGLLLSTADRDRSFLWRSVYFLAPPPVDTAAAAASRAHVVPDPVFIPVDADPARALVDRLLAGPSQPLGAAVRTAVPKGVRLRSPVSTDAAGVITVDLSGEVARLPDQQKEQLSAQLIWTLRGVDAGFSELRLRSNGRPVLIPTSGVNGPLQDRDDWASYDPDGLAPRVPALYVQGRRLRSLEGDQPAGPLGDDRGPQPVDVAAVGVRGRTYAVLTREARTTVLRTGQAAGPFVRRWASPGLASPSWGSGEQGLWFVDGSRVFLDPAAGATTTGPRAMPHPVPVDGIARYGAVSALRVSRDGVRIALVAGRGAARQLVMGRVQLVGGQVRVVALRAVAPGVQDVGDVGWDSSTTVVVLGRLSRRSSLLPVRVRVDGSMSAPIVRVGLEGSKPTRLAAAPGRPLVLAAEGADDTSVLFRDNGGLYVPSKPGVEPFYPG